jgi:hypothetical protein
LLLSDPPPSPPPTPPLPPLPLPSPPPAQPKASLAVIYQHAVPWALHQERFTCASKFATLQRLGREDVTGVLFLSNYRLLFKQCSRVQMETSTSHLSHPPSRHQAEQVWSGVRLGGGAADG